MSNFSFLAMEYPDQNPNPNHRFNDFNHQIFDPSFDDFQLSDYLLLDDNNHGFVNGDNSSSSSSSQSHPQQHQNLVANSTSRSSSIRGSKKERSKVVNRIVFKTKSDLDTMDDGFKWRKYGKKSVKSNPNPRNYYKCVIGGCNVKKRVERDREDSRYVLTTYEGIHNHYDTINIKSGINNISL